MQRFVSRSSRRTLQYLVDQERAAAPGGRERQLDAVHAAFYSGDIAREIVRFQEVHGGLLAMNDLARFSSQVEEPLRGAWDGLVLHVGNTWCQGAALLQMLNMLDARRAERLGHNTPAYIQELASIAMLAMEDRDRFYADPRTTSVPIAELLSDDYALSQRAKTRELCAGNTARHYGASAEQAFGGDTAQVSVVDGLATRSPPHRAILPTSAVRSFLRLVFWLHHAACKAVQIPATPMARLRASGRGSPRRQSLRRAPMGC